MQIPHLQYKRKYSARTRGVLTLVLASFLCCPHSSAAASEEDVPGKTLGYPTGPPLAESGEQFRVGTFTRMDQLFPSNKVRKGVMALPFTKAKQEPHILYEIDGSVLTVDDYLRRNRVSGLLVIKDDCILVERYQYDRKDTDKFVSNSIAKSITSLAVGLALQDGAISSLDDKAARYVPELRDSAYGRTSIRNLLRMSSGVPFSEDYSGNDDLTAFVRSLVATGAVETLKQFRIRTVPEGTRFSYASSEALTLGLVVRASTGKTLSDYISEKLWQPMGAESDATWIIDSKGVEWSFAKFNAVLRDYGRLGRLLANDGELNGRKILPRDYLIEATDWHKHPEAFRPGHAAADLGYGYQFWIFPGEKRRFALVGIFGQLIYVDPALKLVIVQTAVAKKPATTEMWREFDALIQGIKTIYEKASCN